MFSSPEKAAVRRQLSLVHENLQRDESRVARPGAIYQIGGPKALVPNLKRPTRPRPPKFSSVIHISVFSNFPKPRLAAKPAKAEESVK